LVLKIGELSIRVTELDDAHESETVGLKVSPLASLTTTGTTTVGTLAAPFACAVKGFLPTIVYGNVVAPSVTVLWKSGIEGADAFETLDRLMWGRTPSSYRGCSTVSRGIPG
jgi:hypothetical protein